MTCGASSATPPSARQIQSSGLKYELVFSDEFELHKTTLILEVYQKNTYDSLPSSYDITKFRCNAYDDYQAYSEWERSILDSLENAAVNEKAKASAAESAKKI